jgi:uncharacterized protein (TIGR02680 family)
MTARFQPSRAGVINIWDYADEEFVFADGRLVLRGHNGSGKTKALEVLFPFVLDGVADARRLDPFSGDNRTMKSNLLYRGQEAEYGYVWMEFARTDPATETVTLVIGLRAHRHRDGVRSSFFVTGRRLGVDFGLLGPDSRPLTEKQLKEVLGPGAAYKTATDYRDAVDARLFGLGRERYTQLLDLLLALRRPLLAKDLDPGKVSDTLTAGLSPVDEDLVGQAARDFENLAAVQRLFDDLTSADSAVTAFMADYTTYLQLHARARLDRIQAGTDSAVEHARTIAEAQAEMARAGHALETATAARDVAEAERDRLGVRLDALKDDDAYRQQGDLEHMRLRIAAVEAETARERARLGRAADNLRLLKHEAAEVEERLDSTRLAIGRWSTALVEAAERAGIASDGDGPADTGEDLLVSAAARTTARRDDIACLRDRLSEVGEAEEDRRRAENSLTEAAQTLAKREEDCGAADDHLALTRRKAAEDLEGWIARWSGDEDPVAEPADAEALAAALDQIGEAGAPSLVEVFAGRSDDRRLAVAARRQTLVTRQEQLAADLSRLRAEREEIGAEQDDAPPSGDLRTADRTQRPGAALWQLVRFADGVHDEQAAGIEGALYGAGMLTAWIHPDPALTRAAVESAESDGYLVAGPRAEGRTLEDVLVPEDQELVPAEVIKAVIGSIALTDDLDGHDGSPAVTAKAQFGHGIHLGARPKQAPEYIGATNRAARRRARLLEYERTITRLETEEAGTAAELDRLETLLADFKRARQELPAAKPLVSAVKRVADQAILLTVARTADAEARKAFEGAAAEVDARRRRLRQAAADRSMPSAAEAVDAVAQGIEDFSTAAGRLDTERQNATVTEKDLAARRASVERLSVEHAEGAEDLAAKDKAHSAAVEEFTARQQALDAPLKEILTRIEETERLLEAAGAEYERQKTTALREDRVRVVAEADLKNGRKLVAEAMSSLFEQAASFAPYAHRDVRVLLGVADTTPWPADPGWAPERAGETVADALSRAGSAADPAAAVAGALPPGVVELFDAFRAEIGAGRPIAESALKSASGRMSEALRAFGDALASCEADYRLDYDPTGVVMVFVIDEEGRNPVAVFARRVAERARDQGVLLEERERTVLEDELLTGLAQQIHGRVLAARDLVRGMNTDTRSRPMSSGTAIGIRWAHSDRIDERQRATSRLLARDAQGLGASGLAELRGSLREMIRDYRASHPRATYKEVLAAVLDYRTWHTFELLLVVPGEAEVRLTRAKHSVMSGGEKSAAIHLPLFAAANALYSSARPDCPRMIALDEAFAGIDDKYKPDLLGLTVKFGLDLFMTGHDLWVHYDSVPMAAHYDMHHDKAAHAVSAMLILWDGVQMIDAEAGFAGNDELAEELLGIAPRRHVPPAAEDTLLTALSDDEPEEEADL